MTATVEHEGIAVTEGDEDRWDDLVERSPQATPFHLYAALRTQAEHAGVDVFPLVGYKGQEPIGLLPAFSVSRGGVAAALSPAPGLRVPYLGPALVNHGKLKRRKAERRNRRFVEGCLAWLDREIGPRYVHVGTSPRYGDVRPFEWNGFELRARHTYVVDLSPGAEAVAAAFSGDARRNVRTDDDRYEIRVGGTDAVERIVARVAARHAEQDEEYGVTPEFVVDLYERLPAGTVRPYACTVDGEFAGGMVAVESSDTVYRWQGGAKHDRDVPVNDLVDWRIMTDAIERGIDRYDLVGANERRLCGYKAKFAPELATYFTAERGTRLTNVLSGVYKRLR